MATIVILEHALQEQAPAPYMIYLLAEEWRSAGHRVVVHRGVEDPPDGDVAVLHIDLTVVPEEYRSLPKRYPVTLNGTVFDIGKSTFSAGVLQRGSTWTGPVIVKTEANCQGIPERRLNGPPGPVMKYYPLYRSSGDLPEEAWTTPGLIVERFTPEFDATGNYLRVWTFCGDHERSTRYRSPDPLVKLENVIDHEPVSVPDELRVLRQELGFDYGKFDYVCPNGRPVLLDVNKTPVTAITAKSHPALHASLRSLAGGLHSLIGRAGTE